MAGAKRPSLVFPVKKEKKREPAAQVKGRHHTSRVCFLSYMRKTFHRQEKVAGEIARSVNSLGKTVALHIEEKAHKRVNFPRGEGI